MSPFLPWNLQLTRQGYVKPFVVIGATITVDNASNSSGDKTTQGRVFLISLPLAGSN